MNFEKGNRLCCPVCGDSWLHHGAVDIYDNQTDLQTNVGTHVRVDSAITVDKDISKNPSRRRSGMRIQFSCEICGPVPSLVLYQHKGETFLEWEKRA